MKKKSIFPLLLVALMLMTACAAPETLTPTNSPAMQPTATATMEATQPPTTEPMTDMSGAQPKDGQYTAQMSEAYAAKDGHGWQDYLKVTFSGGQITDAEYNALNGGKKKSELTQEEYNMTPPPSEWIPQLTESVKTAKTPEDIDVVTGATNSSNTVKKLFAAILEAAQTGNTEIITLEQ